MPSRGLLTQFWAILAFLAICQSVWACQYDQLITQEANKLGVPPDVAITICHAESGGNPRARGMHQEKGLFQITPRVWHSYLRDTSQFETTLEDDRPFLPNENIDCALWYLVQTKNPHDPRNYLAWFNAGSQDWRTLNPQWSVNHPNRLYRQAYRTWRADR